MYSRQQGSVLLPNKEKTAATFMKYSFSSKQFCTSNVQPCHSQRKMVHSSPMVSSWRAETGPLGELLLSPRKKQTLLFHPRLARSLPSASTAHSAPVVCLFTTILARSGSSVFPLSLSKLHSWQRPLPCLKMPQEMIMHFQEWPLLGCCYDVEKITLYKPMSTGAC